MYLSNQIARWTAHHFNPKCASAIISVTLLVYILIYLIWSKPVSFDKAKFRQIDLSDTVLQPHGRYVESASYITPDGTGVWIKDRHIQVMSAFFDMHHNKTNNMRFVLPSFIKHSVERKFVCCFSSYSEPQKYVEIPADIEFIDLRFMTDIQNGAFECILTEEGKFPDLVSFAPASCQADVTNPLKIVYPVRRTFEFAVCTKVAYGRLDPQKLIEWFEFIHEMGASKVVTFYTDLHPDSKTVFDYYVSQGFLTLIPYKPREENGIQPIHYSEEMAQTRQARQEKTLTVRDCQLRLAGYDYVITIDFDEMPVPMRPHGSLHSLLETLMEEYKDASGFRMDPFLLPPEWNTVKKSNWLYHWRFHKGLYIAGHCIKWIYIPSRIKIAKTHKIYPKQGFKNYMIPNNYLHFLHFRTCKRDRWHEVDCDNLTLSIDNEFSLKRFMTPVIKGILKLPLDDFVLDELFVKSMENGHSPYRKDIEGT